LHVLENNIKSPTVRTTAITTSTFLKNSKF